MSSEWNYRFTPLAEQDIDSALDHIAVQLCNAKAASDLFLEIERTIKEICSFPYSFPDCMRFLIKDGNVRHAIIDNYVLVYEIKSEKQQINFLRFLYAKMNLKKVELKEKKSDE
jgi:plasmid stabilization system protein ParE